MRAKTDQFAYVRRRLRVRCRQLPPTYRYVAAVCVACVVCVAHLVVQQACLPVPAQTTDTVTVTHQPSTADDRLPMGASTSRSDWTSSGHDTAGCDISVTPTRNDDADHVVWTTEPLIYV